MGGFKIPVDKPEKYPWNYAVYQLRGFLAAFLIALVHPLKWDNFLGTYYQ